jgi:hypothetical protein
LKGSAFQNLLERIARSGGTPKVFKPDAPKFTTVVLRRNAVKNYSTIGVKILGKVHDDVEVFTYTAGFRKNREIQIPNEEAAALHALINSGVLNSDEFKGRIIEYINEGREAMGMHQLKEQHLWNDLSISAFAAEKQSKEDAEGALKTGAYKLHFPGMEGLALIKVSMLGELEKTDPEHGISVTFVNNKAARIGQHMDHEFYIT